ncbi:Acetylcholinesterase [Orbilia brochopaga]|nr:Acetylcholinesterase [Drechslerella brochopaga]
MSQEGTSFILDAVNDPNDTSSSRYADMLSNELGPLVDDVYVQYPLSMFSSEQYPEFSRAAQIVTDWQWRCPAYRGLVRAMEKGIPVWTYIFDLTPSCASVPGLSDIEAELLGPTHAFDIPFVLAHTSNLPPPNGTCQFDDTEVQVSQTLVDAWTELASMGNVSIDAFQWPQFNNDTWMGVYIGNEGAVVRSLQANYSVCEFWNQIEVILVQAANENSTNTTGEIPTSPTITGTAQGTAGATQTSKPNAASTDGGATVGVLGITASIIVSVLLEVFF